MYTLFGAKDSGSAAVEIALTYCDVDYKITTACSWENSSGSAELLQINPLMQVPTLVTPDGTVLTESAAIMTFLALEFPASGLLSQDTAERSQQLRSLTFIAANCYSAIGIIDYPQRWLATRNEESLSQLVDGARSRLYEHWDVFSDIVGSTRFWQPDRPGAPEILACVVSQWGGARAHLQASRPQFHESLLRIDRHPRIHPVIQRHWLSD